MRLQVTSQQRRVASPRARARLGEITFAADGAYAAHALSSSGARPFYYDRDPESDHYELLAAGPTGASGNLYLQWLDTPDEIDNVRFDPQWQALHFEFMHAGAGPVVYDLTCK